MLADYTDPDTIRGLLGVNDLELPDTVILLPQSDFTIEEALRGVNADAQDVYETIVAIDEDTRTKPQQRYYESIRLYAAANVARMNIGSLPVQVPKTLADGRATQTRVDDPFKLLAENLDNLLNTLKTRLLADLAIVSPTTSIPDRPARRWASVVALGVDPVTGS